MIPARFLLRIAYPCPYIADLPGDPEQGPLVDLPEQARLEPFTEYGAMPRFADVRMGWNGSGIGVQVSVVGKERPPLGDVQKPRVSDGLTLWLDTRDARTAHRASRYCHQFHLLPAGGGSDHDEPAFVQSKIHRAQQDAPLASSSDVPFRGERLRGGYRLEAFVPTTILTGFDPEQNVRLGVFYAVRDLELGEQTLGLPAEFPYWEDPSLWNVLELRPADEMTMEL